MTSDERLAGFDAVPSNKWLGFRLVESSEAGAAIALVIRPDFIQEEGVVHGGLLATLADTAAVYAFWPYLETNRRMTSIEFKVNFLKPAFADRGDLVGRSRVVQRGRKLGVCQVDVTQRDALVAIGTYTYIFF